MDHTRPPFPRLVHNIACVTAAGTVSCLSTMKNPAGEREILARLRARAASTAGRALRLGIGDDCAILRPARREDLVVTTDLTLEEVHFRRDWHPAESVGHRCLARGLSDLAAMGARPLAAFLSLAVPVELTRGRGRSWIDRFFDGLLELAAQHGVPLAGGDLAQSPQAWGGGGRIVADIMLTGSVPRGQGLLRSGARAGDVVYVTGQLGGAAAELLALERNPARYRGARSGDGHPHLFPQPRLAAGQKLLRRRLASAAIDLSDGLSTDLGHLCEESNLAAEIDEAALPVHPMAALAEAAGWTPSALALALHGGEDYELLFTAPKQTPVPARVAGVPVYAIGRMKARRRGRTGITLVRTGKPSRPVEQQGWEHFRN